MALSRRRNQPDDDAHAADPAGEPADWHALYEIENPADIDAYVAQHPIVASILAEGPDQVEAAFEEQSRLVLHYCLDYEDEPPSDYLVVDIETAREADDAIDRLDRFDRAWWLHAMSQVARAGATVVFNTRFV